METISLVVNTISGWLYTPWVILFLLVGGVIFTILTKGIQFTMFRESLRVMMEPAENSNSVSSFMALMTSTASRVGTGNIVGVSTAICLGGPGALFWMWMTALLGGATAYVESTLAQIYKSADPTAERTFFGGPSYYIEKVSGMRWLGIFFAIIVIMTYMVGYNMLAAFNLQSTFGRFEFYNSSSAFIIGCVIAGCFALCVLKGLRQISWVSSVLVPIMAVLYVILALMTMLLNIDKVPGMISLIFSNAFDFEAIFGGFSGSALMYGLKRGLYSNEAGMGSAPHAAAAADVSHPVKQGLVQMLSVFIDTLVLCSCTGFMCLVTDVAPSEKLAGIAWVQESLSSQYGSAGLIFMTVAMILFAFTTLIGNYYYCEVCLKYITRHKVSDKGVFCFRLLAVAFVLCGSVISMGLAWDTADLCQALMVVVNIPVIILLCRPALKALEDYKAQRRAGQNPVYVASNVGMQGKTECWDS